ncbi:hypothetical protein ACP3P6_00870 [Enterobacter mori]
MTPLSATADAVALYAQTHHPVRSRCSSDLKPPLFMQGRLFRFGLGALKASIPCQESLQHMWDQRRGIHRLAIRLRV